VRGTMVMGGRGERGGGGGGGGGGLNPPRRSGTRPERTPRCAPRVDRSLLAASLGSLRTAPAAGTARRRDPGTTALSLRGAPGRTPAATQAGRIASSSRDSDPRPRY